MLKTGTKRTSWVNVTGANTARAMGSGDLDVFATPSLVALMENAAALLAAEGIPADSTTVGAHISISHVKPSGIGERIVTTAELTEIEGRKLVFRVSAEDSGGLIGEGEHIRYVVDREKFMAKLLKDS